MLLLAVLFAGCTPEPCAASRDLLTSPDGLVLTEQEHPAGWARTECFQCHQASRIHRNDCLEDIEVDGAAINAAIDPLDPTTCVECHGTNGNAEWAGLIDSGAAED